MARTDRAAGPAGDGRVRVDQFAPAAAALLLLFGGMWVANQGGVLPENAGSFAAMIQVLNAAVPVALALFLGAAGIGSELRHRLLARGRIHALQSLGLGLAALLLMLWLMALLGLLGTFSAWGLCALGAALAVRRLFDPDLRGRLNPDQWASPPWTLLPALPVLGLALVAIACPPGTLWRVEAFGYDVGLYHLQLSREWLGIGAMTGLEHNVYSYLPNLMEAAYMAIFAMHASTEPALVTPQLFHSMTALLAAGAVAVIVARRFETASALVAAGAMLAVPWVIITGSMAYSEMAVVALGAVALATVLEPEGVTVRGGVLVGILIGAAALAKLTAAFMVGLPLVLLLTWRVLAARCATGGLSSSASDRNPQHPRPDRTPSPQASVHPPALPRRFAVPAAAVLAAAVVVSPWLVRNALWTGNPVFPMATSLFGTAHWSDEQAQRWDQGHMPQRPWSERFERLGSQWLFNTGYGAVGGTAVPPGDEVARFSHEWGVPVFWGAALLAAIALAVTRGWGAPVAMMGLILLVQILFWLALTHHQARFMVPTVLPGAVLLGWGVGRLRELTRQSLPRVYPVVVLGLLAVMGVHAFSVLLGQTPALAVDPQTGQRLPAAPWQLIDRPDRIEHPADHRLPEGARIYMLADVQRLFHLQSPAVYETPWDRPLIGELIRRHDGDPIAITQSLRRRGVTHIWLGIREMQRLKRTYGFDPDVTLERLDMIRRAAGWRVLADLQDEHGAVLIELPRLAPAQPAPTQPPAPSPAPTQPQPGVVR